MESRLVSSNSPFHTLLLSLLDIVIVDVRQRIIKIAEIVAQIVAVQRIEGTQLIVNVDDVVQVGEIAAFGIAQITRFIFAAFYKAPAEADFEPTLTVLVPCFNEGLAIRKTLERTPAQLASDIFEDGIVLTGGAAALAGLPEAIYAGLHTPCGVAEDPQTSVVLGCGRVLDDFSAYRSLLMDSRRGLR